jgi:hypothetical protein
MWRGIFFLHSGIWGEIWYLNRPLTFIFRDPVTDADAHIWAHTHYYERTHVYLNPVSTSLTPMNARPHTLPLLAPPKNWVRSANLNINEVTTCASLSMDTLSTTERIAPLNLGINPEKCEHPCQIEDLNPDEQVPPQETQPAGLRSVR